MHTASSMTRSGQMRSTLTSSASTALTRGRLVLLSVISILPH
ncbi:MAG: hypothetical protein ACYDA3_11615 [Gaiellaceae bacterium]